MRRIMAVLIVVAIALLSAGCGGSKTNSSAQPPATSASAFQSGAATPTTSTTHLAKTKFVLHAGLAFGAFHRYIYKPLRAGTFSGGLLHHKLALIKAALAAAFVYHEVRLALDDARSSKILSKALAPLLALQTKLSTLKTSLKGGTADPAAIESANSSASQVSAAGAAAKQPVIDQPTPQLEG